ncbi:hypothetical protein TELCIR_09993, partial [Teladorsagia circumcincta]
SVVNEPKVAALQSADVKENPQAATVSVAETIQPEAGKRESNQNASNVLLVKDDPAFAKYFRMLKLGVVEPAVKLKMHSEGVDPSILDNPNAPSPNAPIPSLPRNEPTVDTSDTSSVSSFSDSD